MRSNPRHALLVALAVICAAPLVAQDFPQHGDDLYQPRLRQPGKDMMWLPTPDAMVARVDGATLSDSLHFSGNRTPLTGCRL